jgi:hypothetical protein
MHFGALGVRSEAVGGGDGRGRGGGRHEPQSIPARGGTAPSHQAPGVCGMAPSVQGIVAPRFPRHLGTLGEVVSSRVGPRGVPSSCRCARRGDVHIHEPGMWRSKCGWKVWRVEMHVCRYGGCTCTRHGMWDVCWMGSHGLRDDTCGGEWDSDVSRIPVGHARSRFGSGGGNGVSTR